MSPVTQWPRLALVALGLFSSGCDVGKADDEAFLGPPIGEPTVSRFVPANADVLVLFDRFLSPATLTSAAIQLQDSSGKLVFATLAYDPVTLSVKLSPPAGGNPWLQVGQSYQLVIGNTASGAAPLEAIDGATLSSPFQESLTVGPAATGAIEDPTMHFCVDVFPIFQNKCTYGPCHASPQNMGDSPRFPTGESSPAAGLVLDSAQGIAATAIRRVSHGSDTGAMGGSGGPPTIPFGVDMPIIDPGQPGNSWLLYKTLLAIPSSDDTILGVCGTEVTASSFDSSVSSPITSEERWRLSEFILGREMPYPTNPTDPEPSTNPGDKTLSVQELERVRAWITQGAVVDDCNACAAAGGSP